MKEKILVVDDEEGIRFSFAELLKSEGYSVATADSLKNCRSIVDQENFDLIILDVGLGSENSIEAMDELKNRQPHCGIVVITGNPRVQGLVNARNRGAIDYLVKPVHRASLLYNVKKSLASQAKINQMR
ncbi:MAG: hypothetical protein C0616_05695 [Desulfuromonas sp.]|nr:MAG: hypothetical protein C0616_05695 [Desulfuromonas sp.]